MVDIGLYAITPYQFRIANDLNLDNFLSPTTEDEPFLDNVDNVDVDVDNDLNSDEQRFYGKGDDERSRTKNGFHRKDSGQLESGVFTLKLEKRPEKRERSRSGSDVVSPEPKRNDAARSGRLAAASADSTRTTPSDDSDKSTMTPDAEHPDESMFVSYNSDDVIVIVREDGETETETAGNNRNGNVEEGTDVTTVSETDKDPQPDQPVVMRRKRRPRKLPQIPASVQKKTVACLMKTHSLAAELCDADQLMSKEERLARSKSWIETSTLSRNSSHDSGLFSYGYQSLEELGSPESVDPVHVEQVEKDIINMTLSQSEGNLGLALRDGDDSDPGRSSPDRSGQPPPCMTMSLRDELESEGVPINNDLGSAFCDYSEYIDDEMPKLAKYFGEDVGQQAGSNRVRYDSQRSSDSGGETAWTNSSDGGGRTAWDGSSPAALRRSNSSSSTYSDLEAYDATHRGCHKFVPRHSDEMFIEIGDYIFVEDEADDLWCEGINLRTGQRGIFPSAYATDLSLLENDGISKFKLRFLGSVEVTQHKGDDVICSAIQKVAKSRQNEPNQTPAPLYCLEINEYGIKMIDISKKKKRNSPKRSSIRERLAKILKKEIKKEETNDFFFSLKNVSFCGYHPKNERYFGFITKHPLQSRFACHVFLSHRSTKPIAEAIGAAFRKFYEEYMIFMHQTEDIYIE